MKSDANIHSTQTQKNKTRKNEPYNDISASFQILGMDWDLWRWIVDLSHEISNLIKNMLQLTTNKKKTALHWKKALRDFEHKHGRFTEYSTIAPWHMSKERLADFIWLCTRLRVHILPTILFTF